jgi:hypothetical protein
MSVPDFTIAKRQSVSTWDVWLFLSQLVKLQWQLGATNCFRECGKRFRLFFMSVKNAFFRTEFDINWDRVTPRDI